MKVGVYASMFGKDDPPTLETVESYISLCAELKVESIDFLAGRGWASHEPDYLLEVKMKCLRAGLSIGYLASGGHFVGSDEELERKVEVTREHARIASFLGAPMIRVFCGEAPESEEDRRREIRCFQQSCDHAAEVGVAVGLQNHPCTGDDVLRIHEGVGRPNFTVIMDTGQWLGSPGRNKGVGDPAHDIYRYMEQVAPLTSHVRAKFYKIDSGREEWLDYRRIADILKAAGYNGTVGVVFEGKDVNSCDDREVIRLAVAHLRDTIGQL